MERYECIIPISDLVMIVIFPLSIIFVEPKLLPILQGAAYMNFLRALPLDLFTLNAHHGFNDNAYMMMLKSAS